MKINKFEVDKYYKNNQNQYIHIVAEVETTIWGKTLVAESPQDPVSLIPVAGPKEVFEWEEIRYGEWAKQFDIGNKI